MTNRSDSTPMPEGAKGHGPVLELIRKIKTGEIDPQVIPTEDRRRCVEVFSGEGYSVHDTAMILKCSDRTVFRDRIVLREQHALQIDPRFPLVMVGELMRQAEASMNRLRRIARESGASAMERCQAEGTAFRIFNEMIGRLQSMGYLPRVPTGIVAHMVREGSEDMAMLEQLEKQIEHLDAVDEEQGFVDPAMCKERAAMKKMLRLARSVSEDGETAAQTEEGE